MTSPLALTLVGLAIILVTVGVLLKGKMHPIIAMTLIPIIGALITGFGIGDITDFYGEGLERVMGGGRDVYLRDHLLRHPFRCRPL